MKLLIIGTEPHPTGRTRQMILDKLLELGYDAEYKQIGDEYEGLTITHAVLDEFKTFEELMGEEK